MCYHLGMKTTTVLVLVVLVIAAVWFAMSRRSATNSPATVNTNLSTNPEATAPTATATTISISNFAFSPAAVTVAVGATVTWVNNDAAVHNIVGDGLTSPDLAQGASYTHIYDQAGTFAYRCGIHPSMQGQVVVQ